MSRFPETKDLAMVAKLSELGGCFLHIGCCYPKTARLDWFMAKAGDHSLKDFLSRMTCRDCGGRPKVAMLDEGPFHRAGSRDCRRVWLIGSEERAPIWMANYKGGETIAPKAKQHPVMRPHQYSRKFPSNPARASARF